jgi:hypothetical protein
MGQLQESDADDRPAFPPHDTARHLVVAQGDDGVWHVVDRASHEVALVHCYSRTVGAVPMRLPYTNLRVVTLDAELGEPDLPTGEFCDRCKVNVIGFAARKLAHLLGVFGETPGTREDLVAAAEALAAVGLE